MQWLGRRAFLVLALAPAAALVWVLVHSGEVAAAGAVSSTTTWLPSLSMDLAFRLDALSATLAVLVTGVGALSLVYCSRYFPAGAQAWAGWPACSPPLRAPCSGWSWLTTRSCSTCSGS